MTSGPDPTAISDQVAAAAAETALIHDRVAEIFGPNHTRVTGADSALADTPVARAMQRWYDFGEPEPGCEHLEHPVPMVGLIAQPGILYCRTCGPAVAVLYAAANPATCDACGRYSLEFKQSVIRAGDFTLLTGHVCVRCFQADVDAAGSAS